MIEEERINKVYELVEMMSSEQRDILTDKINIIKEIEIRNKAMKGEIQLIIYGFPHCPDCVSCLALFDRLKIKYEFRDMSKEMKYLKDFMKLRDTSECFNKIRRDGLIGIPCIYISDTYQIFDWKSFARQEIK